MAKTNGTPNNAEVLKLLESRHEQALTTSKRIGNAGGLYLSQKGDVKPTFDYIEKFTGVKSSLSTPADVINQNYIKSQYIDAKQKSADQGALAEFGGFLAQAVAGEIVLGTLEGAAYLIDVQHWGAKLMGGEGDWGNWMSDYMEQGKEWIRKAAPIYQDPDNASRSTWENMLHGDGWWAENGVSVASSLSILIPVAGWARGVGLAGKGLNALGTAARVGKWGGRAAKAAKTVDKVLDVMPMINKTERVILDGIHKATVSRLIESQMEATAVFKERYEEYLKIPGMSDDEAKKAAGEAASFTYKANWAALATDIPQYLLLGKTGKGLKTAFTSKLPGFLQNSKLLSKTKTIRSAGFSMASEGLEEAGQFIISEEGKRVGDIHAGIVDPKDTTFGDRFDKYVQDSEMWTSALFGSLGGGVFSAAGPGTTKLINKTFRKGEQFLTEKDLRKKEETERYTTLSADTEALKRATDSGDEEAIFAAKGNMAYNLAKNAVLVNNWDHARSAIAQLKNATPEEKEQYGIEDDFIANIDEHLTYMDAAADIVDRAKGTYTYGLADIVARRQFNKYMYDQQTPKLQEKINSEMKNVVPNLDKVSKDGNMAIEEMIKVRGMEKSNEQYKQLIKSGKIEAKDVAYWENKIALGEAVLASRKEAFNKIVADSDALNEYDKLAIQAIEGGSADTLISLATKAKMAEDANIKNTEELNYWTSREGRRTFIQARAEEAKQAKLEQAIAKEREEAQAARESATTGEPATTKKGKRLQDLNISEVYAAVESGKARFEDYVTDPQELLALKKAVADFKILHEQNPNIAREEAEEDASIEVNPEDLVTFSTPEEAELEVINESEELETDVDRTIVEDLDEELDSVEAHENIEIPINPSDDKNWRVGDDLHDPKLAKAPSQLAWLSANNPEARDITDEQKALSSFLENPGTIIREYEVKFEVNQEYLIANKSNATYQRIMQALLKREAIAITDIGYLPMKAIITKSGQPVEFKGQKLSMSLHDPSFFFNKNGKPKYPGISEPLAQLSILHKQAILTQILQGKSVTAKLAGKSRGKLNIATGEDGKPIDQYVAKTFKKGIEKINFLIGSGNGTFVSAKKRPRLSLGSSATPGAIYTEIQTANGSPFPLRLKVSDLSISEATLIHALYVDILTDPELVTAALGDNILKYITEHKEPRISDLAKYLPNLENMTYQELLSHLVYEGSRTMAKGDYALTHWINTTKDGRPLPNTVQFGKTKLTVERLETVEGKKAFIEWLATNKRRQIDASKLDTLEYKEYLNNTKVLTTNVQATPDGHFFVQPVVSYNPNMVTNEETATKEEVIIADAKVEIVEILKEDLEYEKTSEFGGNPELITALEDQISTLEGSKPTTESNTVEVQKADIEKKRKEELDKFTAKLEFARKGDKGVYFTNTKGVRQDWETDEFVTVKAISKFGILFAENKDWIKFDTGYSNFTNITLQEEINAKYDTKIAELSPKVSLSKSDKIIWGHPTLGKTSLRLKNATQVLDFDTDFKPTVAKKLGLPIDKQTSVGLNEWRNATNESQFQTAMLEVWKEAVAEAKASGKILLVSDMLFLKENLADFDKIITMDVQTFINRATKRGDSVKGLQSWKSNIDALVATVTKNKVITTDKYLSDLLKLPVQTVTNIASTIKMFQSGIKTATGEEIKVILPDNEEFSENPC